MDAMGPLPAAPGCNCRICRPDTAQEQSRYDDLDRALFETVLRHGWQVMLIHADDEGPAFAYTIGLLHRAGHPELVMSGQREDLMHRVLNSVAERVIAGRHLAPGDVVEGELSGVPIVAEELSPAGHQEVALWSNWFHRLRPVPALQLVWPDKNAVFSWQPGAPSEVLDQRQPPSWRVPSDRGPGLSADPPWPLPVPPDHLALVCVHVNDEGAAICFAAREHNLERGEDWSFHCNRDDMKHDADEITLAHISHLVRGAPSLRQIADLALEQIATRVDADHSWERS